MEEGAAAPSSLWGLSPFWSAAMRRLKALLAAAKCQEAAQGGGVVLLLVPDEEELAGEGLVEGECRQAAAVQPIRHRQPGDEGEAEAMLHRQHHGLQSIEFEPRLP